MKAVFGIVGLLVVLVIVGLLARKQIAGVAPAPPAPVPSVGTPSDTAAKPAGSPAHQVEQVRRSVEGLMQQPRPLPEEK